MQKVIFGIFAHPDDEAFGPCGTLLLETQAGAELHLVTATAGSGEKSMNPDNVPNLEAVRRSEWQAAAQLLGARSTTLLGYTDGKLGNDDHLTFTTQIEQLVEKTVDNRQDVEIEFICFDLNGLTGHIDHIVASRSTCLAFYRLKAAGLPMKQLRLYCLSGRDYPTTETSFVYMEPGRTPQEIHQTVDARQLLSQVHDVMRCHHSQRNDYEAQVAKIGDGVAIDHFIIKT